MPKRSFGFSLVELLIAVSILSVLTAIGATVYKGSSDNSQDQARLRDFSAIKQGLELYRHSERSYPKELKDLAKYLDPLPTDPEAVSSGKQYVYAVDPATCTSVKRNCKAYVICAKKKGDKQMDVPNGCKSLICEGTTGACDMGISSDEPYSPLSTPTPAPAFYRVFVTSTTYSGHLNGISGADSNCQTRANVANLGGNWKAWISENDQRSASSRLYHSPIPYRLLNGTLIADNWTDLTDGTLVNAINRTEGNEPVTGGTAWTNTAVNGSTDNALDFKNCIGWANDGENLIGNIGIISSTDETWTQYATDMACSVSGTTRLYCFEQP